MFQHVMESVLAGLAREGCLVYLDDVLVIRKTLEEHNQNVLKVLERIRGAGLRLKPKKCSFAQWCTIPWAHYIGRGSAD